MNERTAPPPDRPRSAEQRDRIVAAAIEMMAESGEKGVSLSATARRAGVARGTVYYHFADRAALIAAARGNVEAELLKLADGSHRFRNPYGLALRLAVEDESLIRSRIHRLLECGAADDPRTIKLLERLNGMAAAGELRDRIDPVSLAIIASSLDFAGLMAMSLGHGEHARRGLADRLTETWRQLFEAALQGGDSRFGDGFSTAASEEPGEPG